MTVENGTHGTNGTNGTAQKLRLLRGLSTELPLPKGVGRTIWTIWSCEAAYISHISCPARLQHAGARDHGSLSCACSGLNENKHGKTTLEIPVLLCQGGCTQSQVTWQAMKMLPLCFMIYTNEAEPKHIKKPLHADICRVLQTASWSS